MCCSWGCVPVSSPKPSSITQSSSWAASASIRALPRRSVRPMEAWACKMWLYDQPRGLACAPANVFSNEPRRLAWTLFLGCHASRLVICAEVQSRAGNVQQLCNSIHAICYQYVAQQDKVFSQADATIECSWRVTRSLHQLVDKRAL